MFALTHSVFSERQAFDDKCFEFGVELDDIETLPTGRVVYYIAVAANRTDLLCIEGLARSLRSFFNAIPPPVSTAHRPAMSFIWTLALTGASGRACRPMLWPRRRPRSR